MKKILNKKGFTIIEVIVTLAVLGIVIGPLMTMFITSQKINNEGSKEYKSIQLAQKYMEEIKGLEEFNYNLEGYARAEVSGDYVYTKTIPESVNNYGVNIEIKAAKEDAPEAETPIDFDSIIKIEPSMVTCSLRDGEVQQYVISGDIDIEIKDTGMKINNKTELTTPLQTRKIKVELEKNATINATNNLDEKVELYIYNLNDSNSYTCDVIVKKGEVYKINNNSLNLVKKTADNILYNIEIEVIKDAETINTIDGTTIFKYIPKYVNN